MLSKRLEELTTEDVEALATDGVAEGAHLEFKQDPVGTSDEAKREFLADVTSFANAGGGDIIFGISEAAGIADQAMGIAVADPDQEQLRLAQLIRTGAEPTLQTTDTKWLGRSDGRGYLVIRMARSWSAPHRVTLRGHDKFYVRDGGGKHPMNVDELRRAFGLAESVVERIRAFRSDRLSEITSNTEVTLADGLVLVIHVVPFSAFIQPPSLTLDQAVQTILPPISHRGGWNGAYTLEGYRTSSSDTAEFGYTLAFREGIVEAVGVISIAQNDTKLVALPDIARDIRKIWDGAKAFHRHYQIEPPFYIMVSLLNAKGFAARVSPVISTMGSRPLRKSAVELPAFEIRTDRLGLDFNTLFKPTLDMLANAFGLPRYQ
ncbi:Putative DNA-binding domain-containing protein [Rhizobiales bacterium GAS113]|nr:Putative DNA-binding domain-containing protein [Rhizobiales bacterium GAS113]